MELLNQVSPVDVHGLKLFPSAVGIPQAAVGPPSPSTSRDPVLDIYCALITIEKGRDVFEFKNKQIRYHVTFVVDRGVDHTIRSP